MIVAQAVPATIRYRDVFPFFDTIVLIYRYFSGPPHDFWILQNNGHLPLFVMPLYWADLNLFHAQSLFLVVCNLLLSFGLALAPLPAVWRATEGHRLLAVATTTTLTAMMLWLGNYVDLVWPNQVEMYVSLFAVMQALAIAMPLRAPHWRHVAGMAAWLIVATFSFGYGMIGFPVVVAVALVRRWRWEFPAIVICIFLACMAVYVQLSRGTSGLSLILKTALDFGGGQAHLLYALTFVASPPFQMLRDYLPEAQAFATAWCLAGAGLAVFAWHAWSCLRTPPSELVGWALALGLFTVLTGIQTAFARGVFGYAHAADQRYVIGQLPFWAGLLLLAAHYAAAAPGRRRAAAELTITVTAASLLLSQQNELPHLRDDAQVKWKGAIAALNHVADPGALGMLLPYYPFMTPVVIDGMAARGWSVFAWPQAQWIGHDLAQFGPPRTGCLGVLDTLRPLKAGDGKLVEGWGASVVHPAQPAWILLVDSKGKVRGLAHAGFERDDVAAALHRNELLYSGWAGYVPPSLSAHDITAYLVENGNHVCRLGGAQAAT